jgi:hypothetical protein
MLQVTGQELGPYQKGWHAKFMMEVLLMVEGTCVE